MKKYYDGLKDNYADSRIEKMNRMRHHFFVVQVRKTDINGIKILNGIYF